jgi:hypothetical protein
MSTKSVYVLTVLKLTFGVPLRKQTFITLFTSSPNRSQRLYYLTSRFKCLGGSVLTNTATSRKMAITTFIHALKEIYRRLYLRPNWASL